ncbi:MAG: hypothetical protein ACTHKG_10850, partial [Nocardioides sp.]
MPASSPLPARSAVRLSRRSALLGAVTLATAACTPYSLEDRQREAGKTPTPTPAPEPRTDPDVALAAQVLAAEQAVLDRVEQTLAAHPRLERLLGPVRDGHAAHIDLLAEAAPTEPTDGASVEPSVSPSPEEEPPGRVPREAPRAIRAIARAEDDLSRSNRTSAFN